VPSEVKDALISDGTKLGGIPYWGNCGPADHMPGPWRLAVQMADELVFPGPAPPGVT
jgi:hypothetical protein